MNRSSVCISEELKKIMLGSDGMYGKYPYISLEFESISLRFEVNEKESKALKKFFSLLSVQNSRGYLDDDKDKKYDKRDVEYIEVK